jgi:predicted NBD/HSP70 family sugar kinase
MSTAGVNERLRPRGSNHVGMRQFNERVVLHAIRLNGSLPKAEIARVTHLTAQTVQLIVGRLEAEGLVIKQAAQRGKVGQPSVPMALNPDGAFSIGIKIGRRSLDALLVDFTAQVRQRLTLPYDFPNPDTLFTEIDRMLRELKRGLRPALRERLHGVGVAAPLSLGGWQTLLGLAPEQARGWAGVDIQARVAAMTNLPVQFVKDTSAACVAELVAGHGRHMRSFLYVFVDTFIGGGLVLDSRWHSGLNGNAGAVGSLSMGLPSPVKKSAARGPADARAKAQHAQQAQQAPAQLLSTASLFKLETLFIDAGLDPIAASDERALSAPWRHHTQQWLAQAAPAVALAVHNAACLLDLECAIVDGSFSRPLQAALLSHVNDALDLHSWEGVARPQLLPGTIGPDARAIGGALLPLYAHFAPDRELFLKLGAG